METVKSQTPMMAQWYACKKQAKDAVLLFRLGDFYEAFYEDAAILAKELDLTLTKRQDVPMSGVPAHAAEGYIEKLVEKGYLVAIAEQVEDPKEVKGLVKREVVKTVSPGTILHSSFLSEKANNFFASITQVNALFALALLDLSTGELHTLELENERDLQDELFRRTPSEILISEKSSKSLKPLLDDLKQSLRFRLNVKDDWNFEHRTCYNWLTNHFQVHNLDGFGLQGKVAAINATGALLSYLQDELSLSVDHIKQIKLDHLSSYMSIDRATQRNLELTESLHRGSKSCTLLKLLDRTVTPMGARLLKSWVIHPLLSPQKIQKRQDGIEELLSKQKEARLLREDLQNIRDLERLIMRISTGYSTPRDLSGLRFSLENIPSVREHLTPFQATLMQTLLSHLPDPSEITHAIQTTLVDEPPIKMGEGKVIRPGFNAELDELRSLKANSQSWIANYQAELKEATGIKTLKITYSKAFGYCIEVSRGQAEKMPSSFQRRQTLINSERFISPELKAYEEKILTAEEKIQALEQSLYQTLRKMIAKHLPTVKKIAKAIANLDCLLALMHVARDNNYCRPLIDDSDTLYIQKGRHPVIEASLFDDSFIPNDTHLSQKECQLMLITGPNMAGKSTYIRQVALIAIMAQIGSYVPAHSARIGIIDKVFSRIGASDDLARGQSTFMVEMTETANILNNASPRSLVILDEIGRGTSTYDGISIAWAVAEHLLTLRGEGVKTLFATHYWELTELALERKGILNFNVAVKETSDSIVFLRKIIPGCTDKSYGIHVARLAGLPHSAIKRAQEKLRQLENKETPSQVKEESNQLSFFTAPPPIDSSYTQIIDALKELNINETTPLKALQKILEWQQTLC
ncbi:MAG: DNA mismatch repair protein MutS [Simkania sp.]|nr:DNA mismatch repair protein MutS [Simkania sp.]